jgi:glycosyltransferase involved in cell wall biosynthesis
MPQLSFLVAGPLGTRSGGSIYNRRLAESLNRAGWTIDVHELDASFPHPTAPALVDAERRLAQLPPGQVVLVDGLAFGAMDSVIAPFASRLTLVSLVHLPLAAEVGLETATAERLAHSERMALSWARRVIVTGPLTLSLLKAQGLTHHDVAVVEPGTDPAPLAVGSGSSDVHLLTAAALTPGKGHEMLINALAELPTLSWKLTCAGSTTRSPSIVERVRAAITRYGLDDRVSLIGEVDERSLWELYNRSDVVVSPSLRETYGMVVAEALARGLPVVATDTGASATLIGEHAGCVVPPADSRALAEALARMTGDHAFRARCAAGARAVRERLPTWDEAARRMAEALVF